MRETGKRIKLAQMEMI